MIAKTDGESQKVTDNPSDDDKAWTFLESMTAKKLRDVCRQYGVKQKGNKDEILERIFRRLSILRM